MVTTIAFLAANNLLAFLIGIPVHFVGYLLCLKDPRILYLTIVRRSLRGSVGLAETVGRLLSSAGDRDAIKAQRKADLKSLHETTDNVLESLAKYGARSLLKPYPARRQGHGGATSP